MLGLKETEGDIFTNFTNFSSFSSFLSKDNDNRKCPVASLCVSWRLNVESERRILILYVCVCVCVVVVIIK